MQIKEEAEIGVYLLVHIYIHGCKQELLIKGKKKTKKTTLQPKY